MSASAPCRLAIADPPYPPLVGSGGRRVRASRWYGDARTSAKDRPSDNHPDAADWDDPARHRQLLEDLLRDRRQRSQQVLVRLTPDEHTDAQALAARHGLTLPALLRAGLHHFIATETS